MIRHPGIEFYTGSDSFALKNRLGTGGKIYNEQFRIIVRHCAPSGCRGHAYVPIPGTYRRELRKRLNLTRRRETIQFLDRI